MPCARLTTFDILTRNRKTCHLLVWPRAYAQDYKTRRLFSHPVPPAVRFPSRPPAVNFLSRPPSRQIPIPSPQPSDSNPVPPAVRSHPAPPPPQLSESYSVPPPSSQVLISHPAVRFPSRPPQQSGSYPAPTPNRQVLIPSPPAVGFPFPPSPKPSEEHLRRVITARWR